MQLKKEVKLLAEYSLAPKELVFFNDNQYSYTVGKWILDAEEATHAYDPVVSYTTIMLHRMYMCVDYRSKKKLTIHDNYPLSLIEDCLELEYSQGNS